MPQAALTFQSTLADAAKLDYLLHLPTSYTSTNQTWPLILFLHGAGERGDSVYQVKVNGIAKIAEQQPDFPFIAISPQCPTNHWWGEYIPALNELVNTVVNHYRVDIQRQYLTGLSMGGFGAWELAVEYPERFAAIAPVCGGASFNNATQRLCRIKDIPVWAFHGAKDDVVPLEASQAAVAALKACGGNVKLTVYPDVAHDSWTQTYDNPALYEWFLSHRRSTNH